MLIVAAYAQFRSHTNKNGGAEIEEVDNAACRAPSTVCV